MVRPFRRSPTRVYRPTHVLRPFIQMNDPSATGCGSRRLAASTLGSRAPVASAHHIPRLVFSLPFAAAADLRNLCCRDRCTGGVHCGVAGHISPALEANEADIHTAYRWGPSQSHMATANPDSPLPIFLHFEPEVRKCTSPCTGLSPSTAVSAQVGYEEARLWAKGITYSLIVGLAWGPILACCYLRSQIMD